MSAGKETRPRARARARSLEDARAVRAAAAGSREGACPLEGLLGSRESACTRVWERAVVREGCSPFVGRAPPACGQMEGHFVPRKLKHLKEDVKRNDPFLCCWLCLFASSQYASCP